MVDFGDALTKALRFCIEPRRWLPLFVIDLAVLGIVLAMFLNVMDTILGSVLEAEGDPAAFMGLAVYFAGFLVLGAVWFIVRMWVMGALIHQSYRPKEYEKSFRLSLGRLHKIIVATILITIISGLGGMIPYAGVVISFILSWIFFFAIQGIIIDNLGSVNTLKNSWRLFRAKPFDVFVAWLLIAIISMLILLVFALPLLYLFFGFLLGSLTSAGTTDPGTVALTIMYIQNNLGTVLAALIVGILGMELSQVFALKAQTEIYVQLEKKFPAILKTLKDKIGKFF